MKSRELGICLDILGANQLDCALTEHIDYVCSHCLANKWEISVKDIGCVARYHFDTKTWELSALLRKVLLARGLMNEQEDFIEERARELHTDYEAQWCSGTPKPEEVGWQVTGFAKK